jgi:NAD(P)-dependent dehydrogenase (short-subunit alcohol dehydrogenase family)
MQPTRVLITGGSSGIGLATAQAFRKRGARVASLDVHPPADLDAVDIFVACDVTNEISVANAVREVAEAFAGIDAAVFAAGIVRNTSILEGEISDWDAVIDTNLRGVFLGMRECARIMVEVEARGVLVAIGSTAGVLSDRGIDAYAASKAGLHHLVDVAARELGPRGIRVCGVAPGPTDTPMLAAAREIPGYLDRLVARTPLGRIAAPEDIADTVMHVCEMDWVTGHVVVADGGLHLVSPEDVSL